MKVRGSCQATLVAVKRTRLSTSLSRVGCELGGVDLAPTEVNHIVNKACELLFSIGRDPARYESFPSVEEVIECIVRERCIPASERDRLAAVIGSHEVGTVPPDYSAAVKQLSCYFRLGLISNVWASSNFFRDCMLEAGIHDCFETLVFSSDFGVTKPSPAIFNIALRKMGIAATEAVFVGNSLRRDVAGARNAGIAVVWINSDDEEVMGSESPDAMVSDFLEFVQAVV
jgi:FMN phosphatase YigB (HAD superfamily)